MVRVRFRVRIAVTVRVVTRFRIRWRITDTSENWTSPTPAESSASANHCMGLCDHFISCDGHGPVRSSRAMSACLSMPTPAALIGRGRSMRRALASCLSTPPM